MMSILVLVPARGGSKGIPGKNIKPLCGKPLICYTLDVARHFFEEDRICVSSDDPAIIRCVEDYGIKVPFVRPEELATDTAGTYEVIIHALDFYRKKGIEFTHTLLLQPTSPFRRLADVERCLEMAENQDFEMIMSVKETDANPYYVLFEEDEDGILVKSKVGSFTRRQDCPKVWQANGAIYLIKNKALEEKGGLGELKKIKLVMDTLHSIDLDTLTDWAIAECLLEKKMISIP